MKIGIFALLLPAACLSSCNASEELGVETYSCTDNSVILGYRDLNKEDLLNSKIWLDKIDNIDNKLHKNIKENHCQKILYSKNMFCVLYLLKDYSPGGDYTVCHDLKNQEIVSIKDTYGIDLYPKK